jgi:hypothetical protein
MYSVKAKHKQRQLANSETVKKSEKSERHIVPEKIPDDHFIVELDETHVVSSAIN